MSDQLFNDRRDAAEQLIPELEKYKGNPDALLLAIPRGALELGAILRDALKISLDIVVTKKIGAPGNDEYAIGSVGPDGSVQVNQKVIDSLNVPQSYIDDEAKRLQHMIQRRYEDYRAGDSNPPNLKDKIVIVVDDGIATGLTTLAAIEYIRGQHPQKIVLAVPVAATDSAAKPKEKVDEFICLQVRDDFYAVGQFYRTFAQVSDDQAKKLLNFKP